MVDALALGADEGRGRVSDTLRGGAATFDPEISEWGNPGLETRN